ncbi:BTB domain-containing protein [Caerostris extrusa]|uniref:BTB domain-containing protein n=1 Tax=Caerostris extrusa TaxID=172846 RepID=A0AAV4MF16_CAEEX|nr:BTB domain-containing protein [Caerostris extrusa]
MKEDIWRRRGNCWTIGERFELDRQMGLLTDVVFVVGKDGSTSNFKAHKVILASGSPVFEKMFCGTPRDDTNLFRIPDVTSMGFKSVLDFLYDQEVSLSDLKNAFETYVAANKYEVARLMMQAELYVSREVTRDTALKILVIAAKLKMRNVIKRCTSVIEDNADYILASDNFITMPWKIVKRIMKMKLKASQMQVLYAAARWRNINGTC